MKKSLILLSIFVLLLSVIGAVSADQSKDWSSAFTYDVPGGTWEPGPVSYDFEFSWTYPAPGGGSVGGGAEFVVDESAPLFPGYVVMRGIFGTFAKPMVEQGRDCVRLEDDPVRIHPNQPVRFHIGWSTDEPMTPVEAKMHFDSMMVIVDWGDGPVEMQSNEVVPRDVGNYWANNICSFTVRN